MNTDSASRRAGAFFSVSLRAALSIEEVVSEVGHALGTTFTRMDERGLQGDWEGDTLGLRLWLFVSDPPEPGTPIGYALIGSPEHDCPPDVLWPDISDHVSETLKARTGRPWTPSRSWRP
jgi:hypothetical protein